MEKMLDFSHCWARNIGFFMPSTQSGVVPPAPTPLVILGGGRGEIKRGTGSFWSPCSRGLCCISFIVVFLITEPLTSLWYENTCISGQSCSFSWPCSHWSLEACNQSVETEIWTCKLCWFSQASISPLFSVLYSISIPCLRSYIPTLLECSFSL